ncbi:hypothetical protein [Herbiconiux daphne]|uniref:Uncharacterized protein n=1 Tax=Herbiconiux daphne TaxID=2970914 RepID=A0ABT2H7N5_9MICO|nr:hypothetical protein [Herbiconiux daphne]MCS5735912.1 hypothetical protein [Herbiconiux daphne]
MTFVIKHTIRAGVESPDGYRASGWVPTLSLALRGPVPPASALVWSVSKPNGSAWFETRVPVSECPAEQVVTVDLGAAERGAEITETGSVPFTLRLVCELDGVDDLLHDGALAVVALGAPEEYRFSIDERWLDGPALVGLDSVDEADAPKLRIGLFVGGDIDVYRLSAHCFRDGGRIAPASDIEVAHTSTATDGTVVGRHVIIDFDAIRGWNNLSDSGWGGDWQLLDAVDGAYEVKLLLDSAVMRCVGFTVENGRIVAPGLIEADPWTGPVVFVDPTPPADAGEAPTTPLGVERTPLFFGDIDSAASWATIDDVYAGRVASDSTEVVSAMAVLDPQIAATVQAYVDRAERLILTWEAELLEAEPPFDSAQVLAAEAVEREQPGYLDLRDAAADVPDAIVVHLSGQPVTVGDLRARMAAIFTAAGRRIEVAAGHVDDELAPYRAVLQGDKLALFEERPANAFVYTTTDRVVIETPEELAGAEFWFYEGPLDLPSTATVDGSTIDVHVQGWRVIGWQFDPSGAIVDRFEQQGYGSSAPLSAFRPS